MPQWLQFCRLSSKPTRNFQITNRTSINVRREENAAREKTGGGGVSFNNSSTKQMLPQMQLVPSSASLIPGVPPA